MRSPEPTNLVSLRHRLPLYSSTRLAARVANSALFVREQEKSLGLAGKYQKGFPLLFQFAKVDPADVEHGHDDTRRFMLLTMDRFDGIGGL
ncbi:MAG: hypothetical protein HQM06_04885 [Magnetococcales bacterium]|nr:hypothetical protein [Magnetococcales bacterium]